MSRSKNRGAVRLSLIGLLCLSVGINIYLLLPVLKSWSIPSLSSEESFDRAEPVDNRRAFSALGQTQGDALNAENLQLLFEAEDFRTALLGYQLLQRQNPRQSQLLKQSWLKIVRGWLAQEGGPRCFVHGPVPGRFKKALLYRTDFLPSRAREVKLGCPKQVLLAQANVASRQANFASRSKFCFL